MNRKFRTASTVFASAVLAATAAACGSSGSSSKSAAQPASSSGSTGSSSTISCNKSGSAPGITSSQILLGDTLPLTGSAASTGTAVKAGQDAYYSYVNKNGGVQGRKIKLTTLDDQYDTSTASQDMRQLIQQDHIFAISGSEGTGTSLAEVPLADQAKVPFVLPYLGSPQVGTMQTPEVFAGFPTYTTEFQLLASYILKSQNVTGFGLAGTAGSVVSEAKAGIQAAIKASGKQVKLDSVPVQEPGTTNFTPIATSLKNSGANWLFVILTNADTGSLISATKQVGYTPHLAAWGGMADQSYINAYGSLSQGMLVASPIASVSSSDPLVKKFVSEFTAQTGKAPTVFNALGWGQAMTLTHALKTAPALTQSCLVASLEQMKNYNTGVFPPLTFGPQTRQGANGVEIDQIKGTTLVQVAPFTSVP